MPNLDEFYAAIANAIRAGEPLALATIVRVSGSGPRHPGAQMAVWPSGRTLGTVGGGSMEAHIVRDALSALSGAGESGLHEYSLHEQEPEAMGVCGGTVEVFIQLLQPADTVLILGAGHVAQALAHAATLAGFRVLVVDDREEFLTPQRFPTAELRLVSFSDLQSAGLPLDERTYCVIVTRSHEHDEEALLQLLGQPVHYLGLIGSRTKVRRLFERLQAAGYSAGQIARVHAPIGLDIGAETPAEIAISIVAELILARRGGSGRPLCEVVPSAIWPVAAEGRHD